jgi:tRNA (guanine10-N2)-dimethyltransferase
VDDGETSVSPVFVELSGESLDLARAEAGSVAERLGGHAVGPVPGAESVFEIDLDSALARSLAGRLALAHRCFIPLTVSERGFPLPSRSLTTAAFRPFGRPSGGSEDAVVVAAARAWKAAGGRIDLEGPEVKFWFFPTLGESGRWLEDVASVDRKSVAARRISALPFRRPVGLEPRLARAAANLARVPPGGRVVDPFVGTGALLAEAALLGARVVGIDRDAVMVQGALRNFAHLGLSAEAMVVGDSGSVELEAGGTPFDAVLSDLPYGRASGTGGEEAAEVARRVVPRWAERVREGGHVVLVTPGGEDPLGRPWRRVLSVPVRVHRSLTREFRVYERSV